MAELRSETSFDAAVIGAGFGGLSTALRLAEAGAKVVVLETLGYPGGCASTFTRKGHAFESGATLFSGLGEGQLFHSWIHRHGLDVQVDWLDPIVELRAPGLRLPIPRDRAELVRRLSALPGAPAPAIAEFFDLQRRVGDALWPLFDQTELLPPFGLRELLSHAARLGAYLPLSTLVGRPLGETLKRLKLLDFQPLRLYLDAVCQITVQCAAAEAEAPFALGALDYFFRGTGHIQGGVGVLARGMVGAIEALGGDVRYLSKAKALRRTAGGWALQTRKGEVQARAVAANLLPQDLGALLRSGAAGPHPVLDPLAERVRGGWGAVMTYLVVDDAVPTQHVELVQDPERPLTLGNHLFCSVGDPHNGARGVTVSTHVAMDTLRGLDVAGRAALIAQIQERMHAGLQALAPEIYERRRATMPGSPRTFERFTGRAEGLVGGIPRRAGLHNYAQLLPVEAEPGLFLVGDSVFPGQSTLATAVGGCRVAAAILRRG